MLVYFYQNLGKIVQKKDLVAFLRRYKCMSLDPQPRHMGMQMGLHFLIQGSWHPRARRILKAGEYCLFALRKPPVLVKHRMSKIHSNDFCKILEIYDKRCAICGSQQGQPHLKNKNVLTQLQKGHCDPQKPIDFKNNCMPVCMMCNRVYKNRFVFNLNGYITRVVKCSTYKK
jgi:hypothetical protein